VGARNITLPMKVAAAKAIAYLIPEKNLKPDFIIPNGLDINVPVEVAKAVAIVAMETGEASYMLDPL